MPNLKLKNPFKTRLAASSQRDVTVLDPPEFVSFSPCHFPFIKPRLLVKERHRVEHGTPLFFDKRFPDIQFLSTCSGTVDTIGFGPRRCIEKIIIKLDQDHDQQLYEPITTKQITQMDRTQLIDTLIKRGFWYFFRQFPFNDLPFQDTLFEFLIISLQTHDPFSPLPGVILNDQLNRTDFLFGLNVLQPLAKKTVIACPESELNSVYDIRDRVTHVADDQYPASDPWVILFQIKSTPAHHQSLSIDLQDIISIGHCFRTGYVKTGRNCSGQKHV